MTISRRRLLGGSATLVAAAAIGPTLLSEPEAALAACQVLPTVSPPVVALNRLSFGISERDLAAFNALGASPDERYERWIDQQLNPDSIDDSDCNQRIANTRLKIKYDAINQARLLETLNATTEQLWPRVEGMLAYQERIRPYDEVRVATWLRAVYSRRQLQEVMVDFWHNHFNVKANSDQAIAATWPAYDRLIRANVFGNFRYLVEEVGKSVAMMLYLDNASNRAAGGEGGNENYARELFELHTLGSDNYLKFYNDRGQIETITHGGQSYPVGYIDDDVYEASRCLTGWTLATGRDGRPNTGAFFYKPDWHDTYPKTVLASRSAPGVAPAPNIPARQPDLKDGRDVFDLLSYHPGTARHLCTKLCRRLIADEPPKEVVDAAVEVWLANRTAPDQLRKVLRTILLAQVTRRTYGGKVRRPLEAIWAFLRATKAQLPSDVEAVAGDANQGGYWGSMLYSSDQTGHALFGWDTPTGPPDVASYWANTNGLLTRWNQFYNMTQTWGGNVQIDVVGMTNMGASCSAIVDSWIARMCGFQVNPAVRRELITFLAYGGDTNQPPKPSKLAPDHNDPKAVEDRVRAMVQLLAMSPDFNLR